MKLRRSFLICIMILLLMGVLPAMSVVADGNHPITMTVVCDPDPELTGDGVIPELLFTIRNTSTTDYTLEHAALSGGYADETLLLDEEQITVLAGGTREFLLHDVAVSDAQLGTDVTYVLSWTESEWVTDTESDTVTLVAHERETSAQIRIERFIPPVLSVKAKASAERVRVGETFTVTYTIANDTKYDMSGLKLYDPEQSTAAIELPSTELFSGETRSVEVTYTMGKQDMAFSPVIEYTVRQSEQTTQAETPLTVESVVVDLQIQVEQYPTTSEGSSFAVTVHNAGNRTVTGIQIYDEINTPIDAPFDLAPEQDKSILYTVPSAISSGTIRKIRFHLTAVDAFGQTFTVTDSNQYDAVPYVDSDSVKLNLYVVLQRAYYDDNGKLCGTIQFEIRNFSSVALHNASLKELRLFGTLTTYQDLQNGQTYFVTSLQLDGVPELSFRVDAYDPAGTSCSSDTIRLDLSRLKELADQTDDPVYVYPDNPYFKDLDVKYRGILRTVGLIVCSVAALCAVLCMVLYAIERKIKAKLPAEFEENMESTLQKTKRRVEAPMFGDVPTEQFGYTVPVKLRNYGELTEEEAAARKQAYQDKLKANLREYSASPAAVTKQRRENEPRESDAAFSGTRIMPVARPKTVQTPVRDDIKLIRVNPVEQDKPAKTQESAQNSGERPAPQKQQPKANSPKQPKTDIPRQQPDAKLKNQPVKKQPKPSVPVPKPVKPVQEKMTVQPAPEPREHTAQPQKQAIKPEQLKKQEPVLIPRQPVQPKVQKPVSQQIPVAADPIPAAEAPAVHERQQVAAQKPIAEQPEPTAPRILKTIEKPAKRPIEGHMVLRMNR